MLAGPCRGYGMLAVQESGSADHHRVDVVSGDGLIDGGTGSGAHPRSQSLGAGGSTAPYGGHRGLGRLPGGQGMDRPDGARAQDGQSHRRFVWHGFPLQKVKKVGSCSILYHPGTGHVKLARLN